MYKAQLRGIFKLMGKIIKMGLTGGIASGKSEVGRILSAKGIPVIDMDKIGKVLLDSDLGLQKDILSAFGEEAKTHDQIDRNKLRALIFSSPEHRKKLEGIMHPRIRKEFERRAEEEAAKGTKMIVCEAALLIESGYRHSLDKLTVVIAPEDTRMARLLAREPVSPELAKKMFQAQVTDQQRLALADYVIENKSDFEALANQVEALLTKWKSEGLID
ncbi:MAG: dephospho-CoA kinase [Proteobacteria bacterium]|nr:dephospho-CoA kinase [Pseudomonadota bacterium]